MTVGIVGGGITGLALQHYLSQSGVESVVFESRTEPGGVVQSRRVADQILDFGPQRTRLSSSVESIIDSVGLGDKVTEAKDVPLYVYRDGKLRRVPFTVREAISTDLLSWQGKLRTLLEPLTGPPREQETVEEFLTRTLGVEMATYVIAPLYGGIYASHPDEMYMKHSLLRALDEHGISRSLLVAAAKAKLRRPSRPAVVSFVDGMQTLPQALYERYQDRIRLNTPVEAIRDVGPQFELETPTDVAMVDSVVVTTPADVTTTLLKHIAPDAASKLDQLTYNPLVVTHLESDAELDATGYQVHYDEDFRTLGVTCNASLFGRDSVYTCFLGGSRTPELIDWSTSAIQRTAEREFAEITGHDARCIHVHRLPRGMPAYDTTWTALERIDTPAGIHLCANYESRAGIPGRIHEAKTLARHLSETDRLASAHSSA